MTSGATLSIRDAMICWTPVGLDNPTAGCIALMLWPDRRGASDRYTFTTGACDRKVQSFPKFKREYFVLSTALGIVMDSALDPRTVHRALWPLIEYRDALPVGIAAPSVGDAP